MNRAEHEEQIAAYAIERACTEIEICLLIQKATGLAVNPDQADLLAPLTDEQVAAVAAHTRALLAGHEPDHVFLDPARKDGSWCVCFEDEVVAAGYRTRGGALVALGLYQSGYRKVAQ